MNIAAKTDIGQKRLTNQDAYATGELGPSLCWAAVCDGMGGKAGGEVASEIAVHSVEEGIGRQLHSQSTLDDIRKAVSEVIKNANQRIFETGENKSELKGMGTTIVLCVLRGTTLLTAHVGDSRAYLLSAGKIKRLTSDHSLVQTMVDSGEISENEASQHPQKNIITRALGIAGEVDFDIAEHQIEKGDIVILCTDGLSNLCTDEKISEIAFANPLAAIPEALVLEANKQGGTDNITVLAICA